MGNLRRTLILFIVIQAIIGSSFYWLDSTYFRKEFTGDEGFYGTEAKNIVRSSEYLIRPSSVPLGNFESSKGAIAHPPLFSAWLSLGARLPINSLIGMQLITFSLFAFLLFGSDRLLKEASSKWAFSAILLLLLSPSIVKIFTYLEADLLLSVLGIASLATLTHARKTKKCFWAALGGVFLGLGFVTKLWLVLPFCLATIPLLFWPTHLKLLLAFASGTLISAGSHLALIAFFSSNDLSFWWDKVYFALFLGDGISGGKWEGNLPSHLKNWTHPVWYYGAIFYRDHFYIIPLLILTGENAWNQSGHIKWTLLFGSLALIPLSIFSVKEPLYILPCTIFIYLFAGKCLSCLLENGKISIFSKWLTTLFLFATNLYLAYCFWDNIKPDDLTIPFLLAHGIVSLLFLSYIWACISIKKSLIAACLIFMGTASFQLSNRTEFDSELAQAMSPYLVDQKPSTVSFVAPNYKSLQLYLFKRGIYWHDLPKDNDIKLFVVGSKEKSSPIIENLEQLDSPSKTRALYTK